MAAAETDAAPVVQEDGKTTEIKAAEAEQSANATNSETVETVANDGVDGDAADNKETVNNDGAAAGPEEGEGPMASGDAAAPQENTAEPKTSLLDSFLNKSGLGKVMTAPEGGEKEGEKGKAKGAEPKSTVRDRIRKPVAKIFSHRSNEKKDGALAESQKPVKVRSKSLDRLEDPEALNAMVEAAGEEGGASAEAEGDQKASASTKHMKRWHSFKKMMAQKTHKKSGAGGGGGGGEEREEGAEGESGGRDSSTLDSKDSGQQKRWKLKRSWTFQGLKRDSSITGISGKAKDPGDNAKTEEPAEGGEEAKDEGGAKEAEGEDEKEKDEGGEEEKGAGGGTVTQHANEIWTSFKKRVIPKSKRANTECEPAEDGKDGKSAKAKRSHFGRAVSLKNFIMRKGKSTSVDLGEGAKEEHEGAKEEHEGAKEEDEGAKEEHEGAKEEHEGAKEEHEGAKEEHEGAKEGGAGAEAGGAEGQAEATPPEETNASHGVEEEEKTAEAETPSKAAVTNGENSCSNGTAEVEHATNNHQEEEKSAGSPVKKVKEAGAKDDANATIINATAAVNSGESELDAGGSRQEDANDRRVLTNLGCRPACQQPELAYAVSRGGGR
uniref:Si:ch211-137a8.4 n=1 Tax=Takifugu rubripes TaxID=31033 RepID=A0A674NJM7_TAKRU